MRSISTTRGDGGETGLAGGIRVSKASRRVNAYGNVDELNAALGFARSICDDADIRDVLADWSISGELTTAAAFDVARTVCRRAERGVVRLAESGEAIPPATLAYLNRLSDLLWIMARKLERDAGVSGSLRDVTGKSGNRFSRAW